MVDSELVIRKLVLIASDLKELEKFAEMGLDEYLSDRINELAVERLLERIIGRMIDINYHLVTEAGDSPPKDYFASSLALGKLGVLPVVFARGIAQTAGLRNRIVHEYNELDEEKVFASIQQAITDIPEYMRRVKAHLNR